MPRIGQAYRVYYSAADDAVGLSDVVYFVYKPNGVRLGPYPMSELDATRAPGVYYDDFLDADVEGDYLFAAGSGSTPASASRWSRKSVRFSRPEWGENEKNALLADVSFIKAVEGGKWEMKQPNMLVFYGPDNVTEVARFRCYNQAGLPATEGITRCEREI